MTENKHEKCVLLKQAECLPIQIYIQRASAKRVGFGPILHKFMMPKLFWVEKADPIGHVCMILS